MFNTSGHKPHREVKLCWDTGGPVSHLPAANLSTRQVVTAIVESGKNMSAEQKKTDRCPLLYEWHKKQYIGAAHGMAGIYYMLMQVRRAEAEWEGVVAGTWSVISI